MMFGNAGQRVFLNYITTNSAVIKNVVSKPMKKNSNKNI